MGVGYCKSSKGGELQENESFDGRLTLFEKWAKRVPIRCFNSR